MGLTPCDINRMERGKNLMLIKYKPVADYLGLPMDVIIRNDFSAALRYMSGAPRVSRELQKEILRQHEERNLICNAGEDWVLENERQKLTGTGYEKAVNPNYANAMDAHFDIMSFDRGTGEPICIEVKSTKGNGADGFFMTDDELAFMKSCIENGSRYELHRVTHAMNKQKRRVTVYTAEELLALFDFRPQVKYQVIKKRGANVRD